jgi:hypothetical protein
MSGNSIRPYIAGASRIQELKPAVSSKGHFRKLINLYKMRAVVQNIS